MPQDEFYLNRANKYIDELEQRGLKPEYVEKLRNSALENPHRFSDEAIEKNEWFMKNNYDTLFNKQGKTSNMKGGFITPNLAKDMVGSGVGAGIGANLDDENRLRGAMLGGLTGFGFRHGVNKGFDAFISSQAKKYQNIAKGNPQLFNKIVKENIKSSILPTNAYQKVDDLAQKAGAKQNLFAYENSATNIKKDTIKNLNTAKQMQKNGDDELKIWRETGWFKDKDNIWKFELNDSDAKIKTLKQGMLGNVLKHDELLRLILS